MRRELSFIALAASAATALGCGCGQGAQPTPRSEAKDSDPSVDTTPADGELVKLTGAASVTHIAPGQEFRVAARFEMAEGWHIYWVNPGESGLRTEVEFRAPAGFEIGEARFPGPIRFESEGVVSFGYKDAVLIAAPVVAPEELPSAPVTVEVRAEWLACREACVRGQGSATIEVGIASAQAPSAPAHREWFDAHDRSLPRPLADLPSFRHAWEPNQGGAELILYIDGGQAASFFPERSLQTALVGQALIPGEGVGALHLSFRNPLPERVRGVLSATDKDSSYYFDLDLAGPAAPSP